MPSKIEKISSFTDLREDSSPDSVEEEEIVLPFPSSGGGEEFPSPWDEVSPKRAQIPTALSPFLHPPQYDDHSFWSPNIPDDESLTLRHYLLGFFAPCFLGAPCSPYRKKDYIFLALSFILWISILQCFMFFLSVTIGGITRFSTNWTLGPPTKTLYDMGAKSAFLIKKGHIYRLITPILLQGGLFHLVFAIFVQIAFVIAWERHWTLLRVIPIYLLSGIGGYLLSCVILPGTISVGASASILGIVAAKFARTITLWPKLILQQKLANIILSIIIVVAGLLFTFSNNVDWAAHIGGIYVGFFLGIMLWVNHIEKKWLRAVLIIIGTLANISYFIGLAMIFFVLVPVEEPKF